MDLAAARREVGRTLMAAYAAALTENPQLSDDGLELALLDTGKPLDEINSAIQLAPLPFGRTLMAGMRIRFPSDFVVMSGDGEVIRRGKLAEEPSFAVASELAATRPDLVALVGLRSGEVHAVNTALNSG